MDVLKITSTFARGILNLCLSKIIQKKLGYMIDIEFNDLDIKITDGKVYVRANVYGETTIDEFEKIIKSTL